MDAHVQECAEVCGVISSLAGRRWSSRRCCWGRNEKAAVGRQRLFSVIPVNIDILLLCELQDIPLLNLLCLVHHIHVQEHQSIDKPSHF